MLYLLTRTAYRCEFNDYCFTFIDTSFVCTSAEFVLHVVKLGIQNGGWETGKDMENGIPSYLNDAMNY